MKIWQIIKEDFEGKQPLEEDWKQNILATAIAAASLVNGAKAQQKTPDTSKVSVNQQVQDASMKLDISRIFSSGKYLLGKNEENTVRDELRKLGTEIAKHPASDFTIQIVSSESQVPNNDVEPSSPTFRQRLAPGDLAKKRAETVTFMLKTFADQLKKDGVLKGEVNFVAPKILTGDVAWPSVDPASKEKRTNMDAAYSKDQFVYVNMNIKKGTSQANVAPAQDPFSAFADMGESVFFNGKLFGIIFYPTRGSDDVSQAGNKNTQTQDVLLRTVKPDTQLSGKKDEKGVYLRNFVIPANWWNQNVFNKKLSQENVQYIVSHFEAK